MAGLLYVRTGNTGTDPAFAIDDLGVTIPTGASWTLLSVSSPGDPEGSAGQFTAREIRDSDDLYNAITGGSLEWSKDGASAETAGSYVADYMIMQDFSDDDLDLTNGRLSLPTGTTIPSTGREGELFWKSDDNALYTYDGATWVVTATASGVNNDHGSLDGLGDDDHTQYVTLAGDGTRNAVTGTLDVSAGELVLPNGTTLPASGVEGEAFWDSDDDLLYLWNGTQWVTIQSTFLPITGRDVLMDRIAGSTYDDAQDMQDLFHSAGWTSGGALTDGGGGNLDVAAGTGLIRNSNNRLATLAFFDWASSTGNAIPSGERRYVGVEYNGGSPQVVIKTTDTWNYNTEFPLGCVYNDGGTLEIIQSEQAVGDHAGYMIRRMYETDNISRDDLNGGLIIGETGTRNVTVSAGALWSRLNRFTIAAIDTSASSTFDAYYRDGGGGWTKVSALTQWPNNQYDDNSGTLANLTASNFGVLWWYLELDGELVMVYGQGDYATQQAAEAATAPATLPERLNCGAKLIGRYIFGQGASTTTSIESVFNTVFNTTVVTDHGGLSGLGDDDHTQYPLLSGNGVRNAITGKFEFSGGELGLPTYADVPGTLTSADEGDIAWDSDDDNLYIYDGTSWKTINQLITSGLDHGELDGLVDDDHTQYLLLGGNGTRNAVTGSIDMSGGDYFILPQAADVTTSFPAGSEGALAWDTDDDNLFIHDGTSWISIADSITSGLDHGQLTGLADDDHTQHGLLAGNAARNPVTGEYDFTSGDLILPSDGTLKGTPVEGNVEVKSGILYTYDATRSKWLSVDRKLVTAAKKGSANDIYLRVADGIATSETGIRVLRDGTITGLFAQTDGAESWTLEIRRNGVSTPIATLAMSAVAGNQATTTNIDVAQGDELQFFANTTGSIKSPVAGLELAWRTT